MGNSSRPASTNLNSAAGLSSLRTRIQQDPNDGESWLALALTLAQSDPGPDLRKAIDESIRLLPDNYQAWLLAGLEMQHRQDAASAERWLLQVIGQNPALAAPRLAYAQLLAARRHEAASTEFLAIIAAFPLDARASLLYAEFLQNQQRPGEAGDHLEKALELQPGIVENWTALAKIRLAELRLNDSRAAASRALELDPDALEARMTRAEVYRQSAQWQEAKSDYQVLLPLLPKNPYILLGLGVSLAGQGDYSPAMQNLAAALKLQPDLVEARLNIGLVHACQGNRLQALHEFQQLLDSGSLPPDLRDSARVCLVSLQEHQRLEPSLEEAVRTGQVTPLQSALQQAPELLLRPDLKMTDGLRKLALACQQIQWPDFPSTDLAAGFSSEHHGLLGFIDACLSSGAANQAADIAALWMQVGLSPPAQGSLPVPSKTLLNTWRAVSDRRSQVFALQTGSGEAWLRYWHFRLFQDSPATFPGQFKFAPNSIGLHRTAAPQHLVSTVRLLLDEIHPSLKPGPGRACFLLVAIAWIHAFIDGNGRLSRFAFSADLEQAGLSPIVLLTQKRKALTDCQDRALYHNDFASFARFLQLASEGTLELLQAVKRELKTP